MDIHLPRHCTLHYQWKSTRAVLTVTFSIPMNAFYQAPDRMPRADPPTGREWHKFSLRPTVKLLQTGQNQQCCDTPSSVLCFYYHHYMDSVAGSPVSGLLPKF